MGRPLSISFRIRASRKDKQARLANGLIYRQIFCRLTCFFLTCFSNMLTKLDLSSDILRGSQSIAVPRNSYFLCVKNIAQ